MRIAVVVGKEKLGLPVFSMFEFGNTVPKALPPTTADAAPFFSVTSALSVFSALSLCS